MPLLNQITLKPEQDEIIKFMFMAIKDGEAGKDDLNMIILYHINMLDEEKIKSISEYQTRIWILNNVSRILEEKHLDCNISNSVEYELIDLGWVISALVGLYQTLHLDISKSARRRKFAIDFRKILKAEMYLGNKTIESEQDLAETISLLKDADSLC